MLKIQVTILFVVINLLVGRALFSQVNFQQWETVGTDYLPEFCLSGDFDNDGYSDLVASEDCSFSVLEKCRLFCFHNDSSGLQFVESIPTVLSGWGLNGFASGDLNSDGRLDLAAVFSDSVIIYFQVSDGFFNPDSTIIFYVGEDSKGLVCGDLNNDSLCDIAVSSWHEDSVKVFYQKYNGFDQHTYWKRHAACPRLKIADMNHDGLYDLVIANGWMISASSSDANAYSFAVYLQNDTSHILDNPMFYKTEDGYYNWMDGIDVGDLNNDGYIDVVSNRMDKLFIWYNNPANPNMFDNYPTPVWTPNNSKSTVICDLNDDGKNEIVTARGGYSRIIVHESNSTYNFTEDYSEFYTVVYAHSDEFQFGAADLNRDGMIDIYSSCVAHLGVLYNSSNFQIINDLGNLGDINIYPNPTTEEFYISGINPNAEIKIIDILGRIQPFEVISQKPLKLTLNNLSSGTYFIQVKDDSDYAILTIIKN